MIYVNDKYSGDRQVVLSVESSSNEWRMLTGNINRKFGNAQVEINENMIGYERRYLRFFFRL